MKVFAKSSFMFILLALIGLACSRSVTRVSPDEQIDLSGRWNDTDSKLVANKMVQEFLTSSRYREYAEKKGSRPAIAVGFIQNKTSEHIEADNYLRKFEVEIFNSGLADLVESGEFREKLRQERAEQQDFASPETTADWGKEIGADLMLFGTMTSEVDTYKKKKVVNYITTLQLTDVETAKLVWFGQEEIKKFIEN
ncbi:MAG: penicillin-binding protein activator LpoB [Bacteroidota bacterium]